MRVLGFLVLIISLAPLGFGGWAEFFYLSEVSSRYEQQKQDADTKYNDHLESVKRTLNQQIETYKNNTSLTEEVRTQMIDSTKDTLNQTIKTAKNQFEAARKQMDAAMDNAIGQVRSVYYIYESLGLGLVLFILGGFLAFRPQRS